MSDQNVWQWVTESRPQDGPTKNPSPTPNENPVGTTRDPRFPSSTPPPRGPAFNQGKPGGPGSGGGGGGGGSEVDNAALARIMQVLDEYDLGSLGPWVWTMLTMNYSEAEILLALRETPEFKDRFAGMAIRRAKGLNAMSPAEYIAYEKAAAQMMRLYGMPEGFYDNRKDFTNLIGGDVSINELEQRLSTYSRAVYESPVEVRQQLRDMYGVDEGHIAAFFADPDKGWQIIKKKYEAAAISGQAAFQHFGGLSAAEAERLRSLGVDEEQASRGFGVLSGLKEVTGSLAGESDDMARGRLLDAIAGDATAQEEIERRRRRRQAGFSGGGAFSTSESGFALGSNRAGS